MKNIKEGLEIIIKYEGDGEFSAEHDRVWAGEDNGKATTDISEADIVKMKALDWWIDDEFNCWTHFC